MLNDTHSEYYKLARDEMLPFVPESARMILDVGCGEGFFGQQLKNDRGAIIWGIEPNQDAAELARNQLDYVITAEFSSVLDLQGKQFDCVVFNDVLEHMYDPWTAIDIARKLLVPDGTVVASIPNLKLFPIIWDLLVHDEWIYKTSGVLDITHIRFFTKKGIVRLFEHAGYEVKMIQGINPVPQGKKFKLLNLFFPSRVSDMRYLQFAVVARPCKQ